MEHLLFGLSAALLAASVGLTLFAWSGVRQRRRLRRQLRLALSSESEQRHVELRGLPGLLARLGGLWLRSQGEDAETAQLLSRAGWHRQPDLAIFHGVQLVVPLLLLLPAWLLWFAGAQRTLQGLALLSFTAFALGYLLPKRVLRVLARRRQQRLADEVPMLAHLLKVLFEAGLGLDQTLVTIANDNADIVPELAAELRPVMRQVSRGADRSEALGQMARGLEVQDLTDLVTLLRQVERYGGNVQQPLKNFVDLLEDRRRTTLHERVGKLSGTMTIVMVVFLFPALLAFLAGPGFLAVLRMLTGFKG